MIEKLKSLILTQSESNLLAGGFCPKCEVPIRGTFRPVPDGWNFFAPEICATLREQGIDLDSGHKNLCKLKWLRI